MGSTAVDVADDGAADLVQVHDVRVVARQGQPAHLGKKVHLTVTEEGVGAKIELRSCV